MSPKNRRARSCYGPAVELPDTGDLHTLKDVLAGCAWIKETHGDISNHAIAVILQEKIRTKWDQANPKFVLLEQNVIEVKISRAFEKA